MGDKLNMPRQAEELFLAAFQDNGWSWKGLADLMREVFITKGDLEEFILELGGTPDNYGEEQKSVDYKKFAMSVDPDEWGEDLAQRAHPMTCAIALENAIAIGEIRANEKLKEHSERLEQERDEWKQAYQGRAEKLGSRIEAQKRRIAKLKKALQPFADEYAATRIKPKNLLMPIRYFENAYQVLKGLED